MSSRYPERTMSTFDVWIVRFSPGEPPPAERLKSVFGIDDKSARALEQSLPRVVKHRAHAKEAGELRRLLESIGAEVECRPARDTGPSEEGEAAVFHPPAPEPLPGRISAIDPFSPVIPAGAARISVDAPASLRPPRRSEISGVVRPASVRPSRRLEDAIRETSLEQRRQVFVRQALGALVAGVVVLALGVYLDNSVLLGNATWIGVAFDGLGIYLLGVGGYELYTTLRSG